MNEMWWEGWSAEERLLAEQAVMQFRALRKACAEAPDGSVLSVAERLAVDEGRKLTRRTLEQALQAEAAEAQKKGARAEAVPPAGRRAHTKGAKRGS